VIRITKASRQSLRIKRDVAHNRDLVAELVFKPIELIEPTELTLKNTDWMRAIHVTGGPFGPLHRAIDRPGKPVLGDGENVMLRHGDNWWWVWGDDLRAARAAAARRAAVRAFALTTRPTSGRPAYRPMRRPATPCLPDNL
jgi:hypothetical protein